MLEGSQGQRRNELSCQGVGERRAAQMPAGPLAGRPRRGFVEAVGALSVAARLPSDFLSRGVLS